MSATLIFPAVTPEAREYAYRERGHGRAVVAASSVPCDENAAFYSLWEYLPAIHEPRFPSAFRRLVERYGVDRLFVPVPSVHVFLRQYLAEHDLPLAIVNESPFEVEARRYRELLLAADQAMSLERAIAGTASRLSRERIAAMLRAAMLIHGESNESKLAAMMGIFASAPRGDVVEIGALVGRSAAALRLLAGYYAIGPVLTVDPWDGELSIQQDSPELIREMAFAWPPGVVAGQFRVNMLGLGSRDFAHLPLPSREAFEIYRRGGHIGDADFGGFRPEGRIAVLHIDGNHDYASVADDWLRWGSCLMPGGWVIFDDYVWAHGDGPRRVADEMLRSEHERIDCAFACGKALFIRLTTSPPDDGDKA